MSLGWVPISSLPVPYTCFKIGQNSNSYPNPVNTEKTCQIEFGLGGYTRVRILLPCLLVIQCNIMCTNQIEMDIHFVQEMVARGQACVHHVPSRHQIADIFTKGLPRVFFCWWFPNQSKRSCTFRFDYEGMLECLTFCNYVCKYFVITLYYFVINLLGLTIHLYLFSIINIWVIWVISFEKYTWHLHISHII